MSLAATALILFCQQQAPLPVKWTFESAEPILAAPCVVDGVVYAVAGVQNLPRVTDPLDHPKGGLLHAIDLATGQQKWSAAFDGGTRGTTPTVCDGVVVLGGSRCAAQAFDIRTGEHVYRLKADANRPVAAEGVLYCAALGGLTASDMKNGRKMWTHSSDGSVSAPAVIVDGTVFYTTACSLYSIHAKSARLYWEYKHDIIGTVLGCGDGLVFGLAATGNAFAVDAKTGKPSWTGMIERPLIGVPSCGDGVIVFGTEDGNVVAIDLKTGKEKWKFAAGTSVPATTLFDGHVYTSAADGQVRCLSAADGSLKWTHKAGADVQAAPIVADGVLLVAGADKKLTALELPKKQP